MGRPTLRTLALFVVVFVVQKLGSVIGLGVGSFALAIPLGVRPWTVVTSVYAHAGIVHLVMNALALAVLGPLVARVTTPVRFHGFFAATGSIAGIAQVVLTAPFGGTAVLGASGSIFGLLGYLLVGNRASERVLSWLPIGRRGRLGLFVAVAVLLTIATAAPGVALAAHLIGFCLGAVAGRGRVLHASKRNVFQRR